MKLKTLTLTFGAVLALSACVPSTQDQTPEPKCHIPRDYTAVF